MMTKVEANKGFFIMVFVVFFHVCSEPKKIDAHFAHPTSEMEVKKYANCW